MQRTEYENLLKQLKEVLRIFIFFTQSSLFKLSWTLIQIDFDWFKFSFSLRASASFFFFFVVLVWFSSPGLFACTRSLGDQNPQNSKKQGSHGKPCRVVAVEVNLTLSQTTNFTLFQI